MLILRPFAFATDRLTGAVHDELDRTIFPARDVIGATSRVLWRSARHAAFISGPNQTVTSPRWRRISLYFGGLKIRYRFSPIYAEVRH
jgi:hypothetical protein